MDSLLSPAQDTPKRPAIFNRLGKATPIIKAQQENLDPNVLDEARKNESPMSKKLKQAADAQKRTTDASSEEVKRLTAESLVFKNTIKELIESKERLQRDTREQLATKQAELDALQQRLSETEAALKSERALRERLQDQTQSALVAAQAESATLAVRVGELQGALAHAEKAAQQLRSDEAATRQRHDSLQQRYTADSDTHIRSLHELTAHIDAIKRQYFFASALSLKLGLFHQGQHANETLQETYEALQAAAVPFHEWPAWIASRLSASAAPKRAGAKGGPAQRKRKIPQ